MKFKFLKIVLTTYRYAVMLSVGALSISGTASATLIDSIAALNDGDQYRVLFVTSTTRDATSKDINVYNSFVYDAAQAGTVTGGLGLTWTALASTDAVDAIANTGMLNNTDAVTLFNTIGDIIAMSGHEIWGGSLDAPIAHDENGVANNTLVFTGTTSHGRIDIFNSLGGKYKISNIGYSPSITNDWIGWARAYQTLTLNYYGVSDQATHVAVQVPSPSTVILLSLGLAGLSYSRYRKQS
ncbi:hypothetical protein [Paraglaciecola sp. MB-3u-78]|uniref:hypothetical protein n=1 Tax=Paraglaciecola sp. MB-3u-78 TaxID=2058332 RepID=UPI000C34BD08|nr:hypothetical protein [Paraglaciecola sp. MB-3u-78]PKH00896.1 hypothetical protein CXF95_01405 [Paraglaciecola sp. MB-3u-78]